MGAGYAIYVPASDVDALMEVCKKNGVDALEIGEVESGEKEVVIEPLGISYKGSSINIRQ